jgi:hypothetical protein
LLSALVVKRCRFPAIFDVFPVQYLARVVGDHLAFSPRVKLPTFGVAAKTGGVPVALMVELSAQLINRANAVVLVDVVFLYLRLNLERKACL